jgi:hypothetical protein
MRQLNSKHLITGVFFLFVLSCIFPSCATTRQSKLATQRQGLMMQDKSEYSRNRTKFKSSKSYKMQKRRNAYYKKNKVRR